MSMYLAWGFCFAQRGSKPGPGNARGGPIGAGVRVKGRGPGNAQHRAIQSVGVISSMVSMG